MRKSVFLNASGNEVTVSPFDPAIFTTDDFPTTADIGTALTVGIVADAELGNILKWNTGGTATNIFTARILEVRLDGTTAAAGAEAVLTLTYDKT